MPEATHYSEVDSVYYSEIGQELISYSNGSGKRYHGVISRIISVDVEAKGRKSYEKPHPPLVYKVKKSVPIIDSGKIIGDEGDELILTEYDKNYRCDSIYDYGSRLVGYFNSNQTITLDSFEKSVEIRLSVDSITTLSKQPKK